VLRKKTTESLTSEKRWTQTKRCREKELSKENDKAIAMQAHMKLAAETLPMPLIFRRLAALSLRIHATVPDLTEIIYA
jgi:hypothetical protein